MKRSIACLSCGQKPLPEGRRKFCTDKCRNWWDNRKHHAAARSPSREKRIIWAAGFVDGEGCIGIARLKSGGYTLQLNVVQTKTDAPMRVLQELFGGHLSIRPERGNKALAYAWQVGGIAAASAIHLMAPHFVVKGPQADVAQRWAKGGWVGPGRKTTEAQRELRATLYDELKVLNRKGPLVVAEPHLAP